MFNYLRNLTKPAAEKRQERMNAYLDGALSSQEQRRFEVELERDPALRSDLEELRWVKLNVQALPRVRAPRNFILDPAVFGQRAPQRSSWSLYPGLRVATALTAFFFMLALALDLATPYGAVSRPLLESSAPQVASEESLRQADDVAMVTEPEAPAADMAEGDGSVEVEPFAVTAESEVAAAAGEAASEIAEEEALEAEEPAPADITQGADEEQPAEEPAMPGTGAAEEAPGAEEAIGGGIEATASAEAASDTTAMVPQGTPAPEREAEPDIVRTEEAPPAAEIAAGEADVQEESAAIPESGAPFPYLLVIEIVLGAGLLALAIATLVARRGS